MHENPHTLMNEEVEMPQLNLFQQYRRAVKLGSSTSRISNKDWYRSALDLDVQIHCYLDEETSGDCFLHIASKQYYQVIGRLDFEKLHEKEVLEKWVEDILALKPVKAAKAKSLGVVLHLADNFSLAGLGSEHRDLAQLEAIKEQVILDPREVLEDKTVSSESHSWRLFPYSGAKEMGEIATVVAMPRVWDPLLTNLRDIGCKKNFPVRTAALSAPLGAVASLPWCASATPKGIVSVFNYQKFTLLTVFNADSELEVIRHIPHAIGANHPRNFGATVFSLATAYELENPEIYVFPLNGGDLSRVISSIQRTMGGSDLMLVDPADVLESRGVKSAIPLEVLTATQEQEANVYPLAGNATFSEFKQKQWPFEDFLPESENELASIPDASAMKFLRIGRVLRMVAGLAFVGILVFAGKSVWSEVMSDVWLAKPENLQPETARLTSRITKYKKWDALLQARSKAWVNMELIAKLVPEDRSVLLESVTHSFSKISAERGQSKGGVKKEWIIKGRATEKGIQHLENFDTRDGEKIKKLFADIAQVTKNEAYKPDVSGREITVKLQRRKPNSSRRRNLAKAGNHYNYEFDLTVSQLYQGNDPVAKIK